MPEVPSTLTPDLGEKIPSREDSGAIWLEATLRDETSREFCGLTLVLSPVRTTDDWKKTIPAALTVL